MPAPKDPLKREEWLHKLKEVAQNRSQNPEWKRKNREAMQRRDKDPEYRYIRKKVGQKLSQNPEWRRNQREGSRKSSQNSDWKRNQREGSRRNSHKIVEAKIGGFWYGNIRYPDPPKYCELWCPDLWHRIDEAQHYKSILSRKTKKDNGGRALSRHHVYWQPKACCEWDEDTQGYYAIINVGTVKKPNWYKHYIRGDPNKFVLLTMSEHRMISKDKLKWIGIFENLIKTKLDGMCYIQRDN